ncbi:hypothetical protein BJX66DRAFT_77396 [Aspergillus keveii]|uniref:Uncharacterized protein n=1 Tax=Aspergillus keveii TaxID=714993 RepID=A0ABR4FNL4_9EURO
MTSSGTAASAAQALTTPFIPPESCIDRFRTSSYISSFSWDGFSTTTLCVLVSQDAEESCLPSGWEDPRRESGFEASPAVCPDAWTAYDLGGTVSVERSPVTRSVTASTAFCCSSGFTLSYLYGIPIPDTAANACFQPITVTSSPPATESTERTSITATATTTTTTTTITSPVNPFPNGLRVHKPWHITWEATDVSTLHPPPPDLGSCTAVALETWVPGTSVDDDDAGSALLAACRSSNDGTSHSSSSDTALFRFLVIGIPVIVVVVVVALGAAWWWRRRKRKRTIGVAATARESR